MPEFKIVKDRGRVLFAYKKELRCSNCYKDLTQYNVYYCEAAKKLFCRDCEHDLKTPCYNHVSHTDYSIDKIDILE